MKTKLTTTILTVIFSVNSSVYSESVKQERYIPNYKPLESFLEIKKGYLKSLKEINNIYVRIAEDYAKTPNSSIDDLMKMDDYTDIYQSFVNQITPLDLCLRYEDILKSQKTTNNKLISYHITLIDAILKNFITHVKATKKLLKQLSLEIQNKPAVVVINKNLKIFDLFDKWIDENKEFKKRFTKSL